MVRMWFRSMVIGPHAPGLRLQSLRDSTPKTIFKFSLVWSLNEPPRNTGLAACGEFEGSEDFRAFNTCQVSGSGFGAVYGW